MEKYINELDNIFKSDKTFVLYGHDGMTDETTEIKDKLSIKEAVEMAKTYKDSDTYDYIVIHYDPVGRLDMTTTSLKEVKGHTTYVVLYYKDKVFLRPSDNRYLSGWPNVQFLEFEEKEENDDEY